ncbi:MAG: hypothetical protein KAG66_18120, partial [Methylococcales bacterium]|nr:hypothetical protein [Methylococcales bacterium]
MTNTPRGRPPMWNDQDPVVDPTVMDAAREDVARNNRDKKANEDAQINEWIKDGPPTARNAAVPADVEAERLAKLVHDKAQKEKGARDNYIAEQGDSHGKFRAYTAGRVRVHDQDAPVAAAAFVQTPYPVTRPAKPIAPVASESPRLKLIRSKKSNKLPKKLPPPPKSDENREEYPSFESPEYSPLPPQSIDSGDSPPPPPRTTGLPPPTPPLFNRPTGLLQVPSMGPVAIKHLPLRQPSIAWASIADVDATNAQPPPPPPVTLQPPAKLQAPVIAWGQAGVPGHGARPGGDMVATSLDESGDPGSEVTVVDGKVDDSNGNPPRPQSPGFVTLHGVDGSSSEVTAVHNNDAGENNHIVTASQFVKTDEGPTAVIGASARPLFGQSPQAAHPSVSAQQIVAVRPSVSTHQLVGAEKTNHSQPRDGEDSDELDQLVLSTPRRHVPIHPDAVGVATLSPTDNPQ